jgi:hypothetical protein
VGLRLEGGELDLPGRHPQVDPGRNLRHGHVGRTAEDELAHDLLDPGRAGLGVGADDDVVGAEGEAVPDGGIEVVVVDVAGLDGVEQHEPRLEVLGVVGQAQVGIEAQFAVREFDASVALMLPQKLPQDRARHALDDVVRVEEDTAIGTVVAHQKGRAVLRRGRLVRCKGRDRFLGRAQERDQRAQMAGDGGQRVLVVVPEPHRIGAFDEQHAERTAGAHDRQRELALRRLEAGKVDPRGFRPFRPAFARALADGVAVLVLERHVPDADRHRLAGGDPDDACAERDLRADARLRVAAGGDGEQPVGHRVAHQDHGVADAELGAQAVEHASRRVSSSQQAVIAPQVWRTAVSRLRSGGGQASMGGAIRSIVRTR